MHQAAIERVIKKAFKQYDIPVEISDKTRSIFKSKLWRMGQALSKLGGTKRKQQIDAWKESDWSFLVDTNEISQQLINRKRHHKVQLENELVKRQKLESDSASLKKEIKDLRAVSKEQARTIACLKAGKDEKSRGSSSKSWSEYCPSHRSVKKKQLVTGFKTALSAYDMHFTPLSVDVENVESGERARVDLTKGTFNPCNNVTVTSIEKLPHFALYVKDKFNLSDSAYLEISQLSSSLPRLFKIKQLTNELNSEFDIVPSPSGFPGVQQSFKSRLLYRLQQLKLNIGDIVQVKLTGDGTYIAKSIHVLNVAFTLLNEGPAALSVFGNHPLAIIQISENYDSIAQALSDLVNEASTLQSIELNGNTHSIEYFLGGDMKFLATVCGIQAANSTFSCVWCKCPAADRWDMSKDWSVFDPSKGGRTVSEIERNIKLSKPKRFGCCNSPIFKFIPIDHVIIDLLHLFLRVADLLINLFIEDIRRADGIANATTLDRNKHRNLAVYETFLKEQCQIYFKWYNNTSDARKIQWRDLSGPEKIRLFMNIDFPKFFPTLPNASTLQDIWKEFWRLINELSNEDCDSHELQSDVMNWVKKFLTVYQTKNITPYVHCLAYHVPEFIAKYGTLSRFSQQGLEKLNDVTTQHFLRSTNHRTSEAFKQIMEKWNRLEQLKDDGFKRTSRNQRCSICKGMDHNRRRCPSPTPLTESTNFELP